MSADRFPPGTFFKDGDLRKGVAGRSTGLKNDSRAAIERQGMSGQFVATNAHLEVDGFCRDCHDTHTS